MQGKDRAKLLARIDALKSENQDLRDKLDAIADVLSEEDDGEADAEEGEYED